MSNDQNVRRYLLELAREMEKVVSRRPEGVDGTVSVRDHYVYLIIQGRRLAAFTLVLGSEAPEVVYDGQYIRHDAIPGGMEAQFHFAEETRTTLWNSSSATGFLSSARAASLADPIYLYLWPPASSGDSRSSADITAGPRLAVRQVPAEDRFLLSTVRRSSTLSHPHVRNAI